jgi:CDK-activating kinase assembly factor MAT1
LKDFNKKESNFATLRDYNDYLEEVETITFNMTYGIDVEETKQKIEKYKQENQDIIKKNRSKLSQEELEIEEIIRQQEYDQEMSRQQQLEDEQFERQQKQKQKAELIDELMFSDLPAEHILQSHRKELLVQPIEKPRPVAEKATKFTSGILVGKQEQFVHTRPAEVASVLYHYEPFHINLIGPESPDFEKLDRVNYLTHIRNATDKELAGGFVSNIACHRALQEAFCGLYLFPEINNR